jgi:hypothetical protein
MERDALAGAFSCTLMLMIMPSEFFASFPIPAQAAAVKAHAAAKAAAKFLPVKKFGFLGAIYLYTTLNFTELARARCLMKNVTEKRKYGDEVIASLRLVWTFFRRKCVRQLS